jgi:tRNA threonylcarbamoyladenosine biosynthesis protein TsaE
MPRVYTIALSEAEKQARKFAKQARGGDIYALVGPLGSGKTTFTKAFGRALGIRNKILSPTFIVMQVFDIPSKQPATTLYHLDLYRTKTFREVKTLGITEWWNQPDTITIIEWADKIKDHLPTRTIYLRFKRDVD